MKEKIVVANKAFLNATDFVCIEDVVKDLKVEYTKEQSPETFEELKKLCKDLEGIEFFYDNIALVEYIEINKVIAFNENGLMLAMQNDFNVLAKNRTISQMWQIIKNLVGEE